MEYGIAKQTECDGYGKAFMERASYEGGCTAADEVGQVVFMPDGGDDTEKPQVEEGCKDVIERVVRDKYIVTPWKCHHCYCP